jgi:hypothetical protein
MAQVPLSFRSHQPCHQGAVYWKSYWFLHCSLNNHVIFSHLTTYFLSLHVHGRLQVIKGVQWNRLVALCETIHKSTKQESSEQQKGGEHHIPHASHVVCVRILTSVYILIANLKRMVTSERPYLQKVWDDSELTKVGFFIDQFSSNFKYCSALPFLF